MFNPSLNLDEEENFNSIEKIIEDEKKKYDYVDYYNLIIGTLFSVRVYDLGDKYNTNKLMDIFVSHMRKQVAKLPAQSELRKTLALKVPGCKRFVLSDLCNKTNCLKTINYLVDIGILKYANQKKWVYATPAKKLTPKLLRIINNVENKHSLDDNNLKNMIFDCTEDIFDKSKKCCISFNNNLELCGVLKNESFPSFYAEVKELSSRYLTKPKKSLKEKNAVIFNDQIGENPQSN